MNTRDKEINEIIMREVGLETTRRNEVIDQDTGITIKVNGMNVVGPGCYGGRDTVEFDPANNKKMMSQIFGYFLDKYSEESDVDVVAYYNVDGKDNKSHIECKMSDSTIVESGDYNSECLKLTDIIMRLNGDPNPDLSKFDSEPIRNSVRKKSTTHAKKSNTANSKTAKRS